MQKVIPAILASEPEDLFRKLEILKGISEWVQIDIMDGKLVPNTSCAVLALNDVPAPFSYEIHLMVENPEDYFEDCKSVGAKRVIFHIEGTKDAKATLEQMERYDFEKGIALNPETPASAISPFTKNIDTILFLTVHPGFQGQEFIPQVLEKVRAAKTLAPLLLTGVDGGVNEPAELRQVFKAGADYVVVGSGLWQRTDPKAALLEMQAMIQ